MNQLNHLFKMESSTFPFPTEKLAVTDPEYKISPDFQKDNFTLSDLLNSTFTENEPEILPGLPISTFINDTKSSFTDEMIDILSQPTSTFTDDILSNPNSTFDTMVDILNQPNLTFSTMEDILNQPNLTFNTIEDISSTTFTNLSNGIQESSSLTTVLNEINSTFISNQTSKPELPFYLNFREEPWVVPLVAFALFNVVTILFFEIYVLYRSCGGRRHLFLGQILLMGLLMSSILALVYILQPHWLLCGITRAGLGIAYAIIFGTLLVKCVFLLKIHSGMYMNSSLQGLLLFFIVSTEIAIVTMWLHYEPPTVSQNFLSSEPSCTKTVLERVSFLAYNMFLMFLVIILSIRSKSLRENNREAMYIGISIGITLVLWVAWISVLVIFGRSFEAPAEAFGLVSISLVIFVLIFIPKAVHLARSRKQEKHASANHSVLHTPSFLRLQPQAVLPPSTHGTLMKQSGNVNADYCRGFDTRVWKYDYPSFRRQSNPPTIVQSDYNSLKKSTGSGYSNPDY